MTVTATAQGTVPRYNPTNAFSDIKRCLERVTCKTGHRQYRVFRDWVSLCLATHSSIPRHIEAIHRTGAPSPNTDEEEELWTRLRATYPPKAFDDLTKAYAYLVYYADTGAEVGTYGWDLLGQCYMQFGWPSQAKGQYFTPWPVCKMMAQMLAGDIEPDIHARIKAALTHEDNLAGQSLLMMSLVVPEDRKATFFRERLIPAALPYFKPFTVNEPCIGSGTMLLAFASIIPQWILDHNLVYFCGQDIDALCVDMARLNFMLYGLDTHKAKCHLTDLLARDNQPTRTIEEVEELDIEEVIQAEPPPRVVVEESEEVKVVLADETKTVEEKEETVSVMSNEVRRASQLSLF